MNIIQDEWLGGWKSRIIKKDECLERMGIKEYNRI